MCHAFMLKVDRTETQNTIWSEAHLDLVGGRVSALGTGVGARQGKLHEELFPNEGVVSPRSVVDHPQQGMGAFQPPVLFEVNHGLWLIAAQDPHKEPSQPGQDLAVSPFVGDTRRSGDNVERGAAIPFKPPAAPLPGP